VPSPRRPTRQAVDEATAALRRVLRAIENGELEVTTPQEVALVRRLEGALVGLEKVSGHRRKSHESPD
jgi:hypothetical protein